jgi:hypothetical protein
MISELVRQSGDGMGELVVKSFEPMNKGCVYGTKP